MITNVQPGIYDLSNDQYHESVGISRSAIMKFRRSPLHYWQDYINPLRVPEKSTGEMVIGNAFHTLVLEPDFFTDRFLVSPKLDKRTKEGKKLWESMELSKGSREIIFQDDFEHINAMSNSVKSLKFESIEGTANDLLLGAQYEKSIYWIDKETEVLCKARPDILAANMVCDLKTCLDGSFYAFRRAVYDYGYHIQCAMMADGIQAVLNKPMHDFIFIAVEKKPPYAVAIYQLSEDILEEGRVAYKKSLAEYKKCFEKTYWPSYEIKTIEWEKR